MSKKGSLFGRFEDTKLIILRLTQLYLTTYSEKHIQNTYLRCTARARSAFGTNAYSLQCVIGIKMARSWRVGGDFASKAAQTKEGSRMEGTLDFYSLD